MSYFEKLEITRRKMLSIVGLLGLQTKGTQWISHLFARKVYRFQLKVKNGSDEPMAAPQSGHHLREIDIINQRYRDEERILKSSCYQSGEYFVWEHDFKSEQDYFSWNQEITNQKLFTADTKNSDIYIELNWV